MVAANSTPLRYPIDIRCPIGGGVFAKGKAGKFGIGGTPTEKLEEAADAYKGHGYRDINAALRGEETASKADQEHIKNLTSLIEHHGVTESAGVVYRGVSGGKAMRFDEMIGKVGQKITIPGFLSTSKSEKFAKQWTYGGKGTTLRIYVPKGAKALDYEAMINKATGGSHFKDGEHEVILPHNSKFTVHAVTKNSKGKATVDLIMHR